MEALRKWREAQKGRANYGEFAGAVVRVIIGFLLLFGYFAWVDWGEQSWALYICVGFFVYALVLFAVVYRSNAPSDFVRYHSVALDMGTATLLLGLTGEVSAIVLFVYTWAAVAHGFRFGLRYLRIAWVAGLCAFVGVYALSAATNGFWYQHPLVWLGAFIWIGAPTMYVYLLLEQKLAAVQAAEEARLQAERARAEAERERVERARVEAERARADAEAASEAKSEFLATMSHEMRTPLNGVVGASELLAIKELAPGERQLVDWLLASSRQLRSLIDNLLDLRKIEAGKMAIERTPFDLHVLMNRVAALFEPEAKRAQLRFTKSVSADAPYLLIGDDARIQQVLINLTANALKFTREGWVRLSAGALARSGEDVTLHFEVRDTGIGIAPEDAARIFDRFTQANAGIHRQYGGSGLGTTICRHLVELMGGTINFGSQPGKGTTFWFTVPLVRRPAQDEPDEDAVATALRELRLGFISSRAGAGEWIARAARAWRVRHALYASLADFVAAARRDAQEGASVLAVDGDDRGIDWRQVPAALARAGTPLACILVHPGAADGEAFDAGYACAVRTREPRLLRAALRSIVAGTSAARPAAEFPGQRLPGLTGLRVLVAEDNPISQQIIAMMLRSGGHQVTVVGDGDSVLEHYRNVAFDVAVLDMHMPGCTGLDVARAIRRLESDGRSRRTPIVMLTAAASTDLREDSLGAGVDLFLSKPIDPRALLRGVHQVFSAAATEAPAAARAARSADPYVDRELLRDMAALAPDAGFVRALTSRFAEDACALVERIEAAVERADHREFHELAHALKGAAMMAGATGLRDSAARLESVPAAEFASVGPATLRDLRGTLEATRQALSTL